MFRVLNLFSIFSFIFHYIINCTPLSSISDNHCRHHQYIPYQKELICEVINDGLTLSRIEKQYHVPKNFVRYILFIHKSQSTRISDSRSDRFKVLTTREQRYIIRIARRDFKIIYKISKFMSKLTVSPILFIICSKRRILSIEFAKKKFSLTFKLVDKRYT